MLLLIIKELQTSHNSRRANHREKFSKYRKHKALTYYIEQDILAITCSISIALLKAFSKKNPHRLYDVDYSYSILFSILSFQ